MAAHLSAEFERILAAGNQAPSGENCQPWHFVVRGESIEVHLLPERDKSAYSWGQRASYLADGAAIENLVIAASAEGYRTDVRYFPAKGNATHVATLVLTRDATTKPDVLAPYVMKRMTNRKPYAKEPLASSERTAFVQAAQGAYGTLVLTEEAHEIATLGRIGSTNEELMLANRGLHDFFFEHVSWTKEEDEQKKVGFYIKTLELPPPAEKLFRVFQKWPVMNVLARLGFTSVVAKQNAAQNAAASAIGAVLLDALDPLDFVKVGRTIERLWLTATSVGLALQPLVGIPLFRLRLVGGDTSGFSEKEQAAITRAYDTAARVFDAGDRQIVFMFRIGHADPATAQAVRFSLEEVVTVIG